MTRSMLMGVRDELRARIDETNARIDGLSARVDGSRSEVLAEVHRIGTLVEDQEARNRIVVEAVQGHNARFERLEKGLDEVHGMIREILDVVRQKPQP